MTTNTQLSEAARRFPVIFLPGSIVPAELAYGQLIAAFGDRTDAVAKELEVYRDDTPPAGYGFGVEVEGVLRVADERGFDRFHLAGYSAGGGVALVLASRYPERLASLALLEPAWSGNERTPREAALFERFRAVVALPEQEQSAEFIRLHLALGVPMPPTPEGPPPAWMAKRPAGIRALRQAFDEQELDLSVLRAFRAPVYFAVGGRSNPDFFVQSAQRLDTVFWNFTVEMFPQRHHFDPPQLVEPERLGASLFTHWERAA